MIKNNGHSFQTSSSNWESRFTVQKVEISEYPFYSFYSMLRELLCNARNANREAGVGDNALRVRCEDAGTFFSGKVYVLTFEDDGSGITPESMQEVYERYATPLFSVIDTFFIETVTNGVERTYQAALDAEGSKVVELLSKATEQPNGTRVKVPFSDSDVKRVIQSNPGTFLSNVKDLLSETTKYMKEEVSLNGIALEKSGILFETDGYIYLSKCSGMDGIIASVDGIYYKIPGGNMQFRIPALHSSRVILKLPVNVLQFSPTKEAAANNVKFVQRALDEFDFTVLGEIEKYLSAAADTYACAYGLTMKLVDYTRKEFVVKWRNTEILAKRFLVYEYNKQKYTYRNSRYSDDLYEKGEYPKIIVTGLNIVENISLRAYLHLCEKAGVDPEAGFSYITDKNEAHHHEMMGAKVINISSLVDLDIVKRDC